MKHNVLEAGSVSVSETLYFIKKLDGRQSPKQADYVSDSYTIVRALQSWMYMYVIHVTQHTNMFKTINARLPMRSKHESYYDTQLRTVLQ
jgi:hypothetical protein